MSSTSKPIARKSTSQGRHVRHPVQGSEARVRPAHVPPHRHAVPSMPSELRILRLQAGPQGLSLPGCERFDLLLGFRVQMPPWAYPSHPEPSPRTPPSTHAHRMQSSSRERLDEAAPARLKGVHDVAQADWGLPHLGRHNICADVFALALSTWSPRKQSKHGENRSRKPRLKPPPSMRARHRQWPGDVGRSHLPMFSVARPLSHAMGAL